MLSNIFLNVPFWPTPWNYQKTSVFFMFSGGIKRAQYEETGQNSFLGHLLLDMVLSLSDT